MKREVVPQDEPSQGEAPSLEKMWCDTQLDRMIEEESWQCIKAI